MFMYNDAHVSYEQRVEHEYQDIYVDNYFDPAMKMYGQTTVVHILNVRSMGIEVTVTAETGYQFSQAVVMSCLLAALKNIEDGFLFTAACAKVRSQMGFEIDKLIPASVATPTDVEYGFNENTHWHYNVVASLAGVKGTFKPRLELIAKDTHIGMVEMRLSFLENGYVKPREVSILIDHEVINNSSIMSQATDALWCKAYEKMPESAVTLSYMRYTEGMLDGKQFHKGGYIPPNHTVDMLAYSAKKGYGKDSRVDELPGVDELVKHPISKREMPLGSAIINLNDQHKWTREKIADWIETLDIDITFKVNTDEQD
jgi:hypothetical protein